MRQVVIWSTLLTVVLVSGLPAFGDSPVRTENVIVVTLDGFRWQELLTGADEDLLNEKDGGVRDVPALKARFWRDTPEERRAALLPFFWGTVARQGQVFGDPSQGSAVTLTNGRKFSYPGYNELFCGFADERIDSNAKRPNPNLSVFEFLNERSAFRDRVAVFCTWDVFPSIFRTKQNGLTIHAGWTPIVDEPLTEPQQQINALIADLPHYWPSNAFDIVSMQAAREHLRRHQPRVLYLGLGETDEWAHARRYDLYLAAAHNADRYLADLWSLLEQMPQYAGKTSLVLTTDHGRGSTRRDWTDHGANVPGAEYLWIAVLGPDTPALGLREDVAVTQSQVAATIAELLGEDFRAVSPKAAGPLPCRP